MDDAVWNKYWELLTDIAEHGTSIMKGTYWGAAEFAVTAGTDVLDDAISEGVVRKTKNGKLAIPIDWATAILEEDDEEEYVEDPDSGEKTVWEEPAVDESINGASGIHLRADKTETVGYIDEGPMSVSGLVPAGEVQDHPVPEPEMKKESLNESVMNAAGALFGNNNSIQKPVEKHQDVTLNYDQYGNVINPDQMVQQPMQQVSPVQQPINNQYQTSQPVPPVQQPVSNMQYGQQPLVNGQPYPQQVQNNQYSQNQPYGNQTGYSGMRETMTADGRSIPVYNGPMEQYSSENQQTPIDPSIASKTGGLQIKGVDVEKYVNADKTDKLLKDPDEGFGKRMPTNKYGIVEEEDAKKIRFKIKMKKLNIVGIVLGLLSLILLFVLKIPTIGVIGGFLGLVFSGVSWVFNRDKKIPILTILSLAVSSVTLLLALGMSFVSPKESTSVDKNNAKVVNTKQAEKGNGVDKK